jgi:hypothetical protein
MTHPLGYISHLTCPRSYCSPQSSWRWRDAKPWSRREGLCSPAPRTCLHARQKQRQARDNSVNNPHIHNECIVVMIHVTEDDVKADAPHTKVYMNMAHMQCIGNSTNTFRRLSITITYMLQTTNTFLQLPVMYMTLRQAFLIFLSIKKRH